MCVKLWRPKMLPSFNLLMDCVSSSLTILNNNISPLPSFVCSPFGWWRHIIGGSSSTDVSAPLIVSLILPRSLYYYHQPYKGYNPQFRFNTAKCIDRINCVIIIEMDLIWFYRRCSFRRCWMTSGMTVRLQTLRICNDLNLNEMKFYILILLYWEMDKYTCGCDG